MWLRSAFCLSSDTKDSGFRMSISNALKTRCVCVQEIRPGRICQKEKCSQEQETIENEGKYFLRVWDRAAPAPPRLGSAQTTLELTWQYLTPHDATAESKFGEARKTRSGYKDLDKRVILRQCSSTASAGLRTDAEATLRHGYRIQSNSFYPQYIPYSLHCWNDLTVAEMQVLLMACITICEWRTITCQLHRRRRIRYTSSNWLIFVNF